MTAPFEGFCIRGLLSIFVSRAMEHLAAEINAIYPNSVRVSDHGYWFKYFSNVGWLTRQARDISNRNKRVVLIGHSFGATAAIMVAKNLNAQGIGVDLLCPIDPAAQYPTAVSHNVKRIVAFYQTTPGDLGEGVVRAGPGWYRGDWTNRVVEYHRTEGHLAIANDPFVHAKILEAIKELI